MAKFPARLPRSRLEKPISREQSQPAHSYEQIANFTKDLEVRRDLGNRASPVNRAYVKRPLESVRKELDVAWERYDSFYENFIATNLPERELDRVKDRYTEIVVQYEECTIRINDYLTQMKKTNTKGKPVKSAPCSK